jgi:hypothetical protein
MIFGSNIYPNLFAFYDVYSESLYSSAANQNTIHATMLKGGFSFEANRHRMDPFAEVVLFADADGEAYQNAWEYRGHLRYLYSQTTWSASLTYSAILRRPLTWVASSVEDKNIGASHRLMLVYGAFLGV